MTLWQPLQKISKESHAIIDRSSTSIIASLSSLIISSSSSSLGIDGHPLDYVHNTAKEMMILVIALVSATVAYRSLFSCNALIILPRGSNRNLHRAAAGLSSTPFHRHIITTSSLNSSPDDSVSDAINSPILRSLYDPLPRIDCNGTVSNENNTTEVPKWVNKVTSGTLEILHMYISLD